MLRIIIFFILYNIYIYIFFCRQRSVTIRDSRLVTTKIDTQPGVIFRRWRVGRLTFLLHAVASVRRHVLRVDYFYMQLHTRGGKIEGLPQSSREHYVNIRTALRFMEKLSDSG